MSWSEMAHRRDFLKKTGVLSTILAARAFTEWALQPEIRTPEQLEYSSPSIPRHMRGITVNSPFAWYTDCSELIDQCKQIGANNIRIFISDEVEPEVGLYKSEPIIKIRKFLEDVWQKSDGTIGVNVDVFNSYSLLSSNKWNPIYNSTPLSSPYLYFRPQSTAQEGQMAFFTDIKMINAFSHRAQWVMSELKDLPAITSWTVANEPDLAVPSAQNILTKWFASVVPLMHVVDSTRPIFTGLAKPWLLDESAEIIGLTGNTIHLYWDGTMGPLDAFSWYLNSPTRKLPLYLQEIGIPYSAPDQMAAAWMAKAALTQISGTNKVNGGGVMGVWKLGSHIDGYDLSPSRYPKNTQVLNHVAKLFAS